MECVRELVFGKRVAVTGAAGSIGSAIVAEVANLAPESILGVDIAKPADSGACNISVQQDIRDEEGLQRVFLRFRPQIVFHAAALKDVPDLESRATDAVLTNVFGTANLLNAARASGAARTVLISTDKAVRPASVMGATKRICELMFRSFGRTYGGFVTVRLGNVAGSRGSVLPLFEQQIATGQALTVTHPEMQRYFLNVREAVEAILGAAVLGHKGEIFFPNMGAPVSILRLARDLIGNKGGTDIQFTGIRPGEKLSEELWDRSCEVPRPAQFGLEEIVTQGDSLMPSLPLLRAACSTHDDNVVISALRALLPEYHRIIEAN